MSSIPLTGELDGQDGDGSSNGVPLPWLQAHLWCPLGSPFHASEQTSGRRACLGSRWAHVGSSSRLCSMKITTRTPSTACARCYENSWSRPRESCSMLPSLPGKFGETGNGLSICPCRHCPGLTLSPKLTLPEDQGHSFWRWMCRSGVCYSFTSQKGMLSELWNFPSLD